MDNNDSSEKKSGSEGDRMQLQLNTVQSMETQSNSSQSTDAQSKSSQSTDAQSYSSRSIGDITDQSSAHHAAGSQFSDLVAKRAHAQQLMKDYFTQLTEGCGNIECENEMCASCPQFTMKDKDTNARAACLFELVSKKAQLCVKHDHHRSTPSKEQKDGAWSSASGGRHFLTLPGPSTAGAAGTSPKLCSPSLQTTPKSIATSPAESGDCFLNEQKLGNIVDHCKATGDWSPLIKTIGSIFSNPDALIMSFRFGKDSVQTNSDEMETEMANDEGGGEMEVDTEIGAKEQHHSMDVDSEKDVDEKEEAEDCESGESLSDTSAKLEVSPEDMFDQNDKDFSVDVKSLRRCYGMLVDIPNHPFQGALINALISLANTMNIDLRYARRIQHVPHFLNIFVVVMEIPFLHSPEFIERAYPEICKVIGQLTVGDEAKLVRYWSKFSAERLNEMVLSIQQLLTVKIIDGEMRWGRGYHLNEEANITGPIKVMKILYYASLYGGDRDPKSLLEEERSIQESDSHLQHELRGANAIRFDIKEPRQAKDDPLAKELDVSHMDCRKPLVAYEEFVNETLNEHINIEVDYRNKLESEDNPSKFSFNNYSFIMTTASKQASLNMDNRIQMYRERRQSILETLMHGLPQMPLLRVRVSRDTIIADALVALETYADNPAEFRKQLFVEFEGEQGLDEGGVSKEFFQLIIEEIFNVDFGMFTYNADTNQFWFNSTSFENEGQFLLIGIVLGLAIYNSTIVDVHFPAVVYRKLVGKKGTFADLGDVDPTLKNSLDEMLAYESEDFEDVFMQSFQISFKDVFGCTITQDLKEKGDEIPVTQENKQEFVNLYADYVLNKSIETQFRAFRWGFQLVTSESPLRSLFRPDEIELLVCGSENLDFAALEESCEYDGGFDRFSRTIRNFWEVVHSFSEEQKRKLLQFTTGTDRVPVGGLAKLKLIIARNGPDSERLPTAHTCFNVLLLPDYENKQKLQERLLKAITYSKGFGML